MRLSYFLMHFQAFWYVFSVHFIPYLIFSAGFHRTSHTNTNFLPPISPIITGSYPITPLPLSEERIWEGLNTPNVHWPVTPISATNTELLSYTVWWAFNGSRFVLVFLRYFCGDQPQLFADSSLTESVYYIGDSLFLHFCVPVLLHSPSWLAVSAFSPVVAAGWKNVGQRYPFSSGFAGSFPAVWKTVCTGLQKKPDKKWTFLNHHASFRCTASDFRCSASRRVRPVGS